jgi:oxygen-independent coproporphyrinogen-3 oxidase
MRESNWGQGSADGARGARLQAADAALRSPRPPTAPAALLPGESFQSVPDACAWRPGFALATWIDALAALACLPDDPVSVAIHVPLCAQRCAYCAEQVTGATNDEVVDRYLDTLAQELELVGGALGERRQAARLHVGGGTPNILRENQLERVRRMLDERFELLADAETSIGCDPRLTSRSQIEQLRALGFRHIRFGMADLDHAVQLAAGRLQSADLVADAVGLAQAAGFETVQLDLVCGLPGQDASSLAKTLERLVAIGPDRVQCLRYVHEPQAHPDQRTLARDGLPGPGVAQSLFGFACHALRAAGYQAIGDGWFVLDTDEWLLARESGALRRSPLGYQAVDARHLLAFGPGRVSDVAGTLARNEPLRTDWERRVRAGRMPVADAHRRTDFEARQRAAVDHLFAYHQLPARMLAGELEPAWSRIVDFVDHGWLVRAPDRVLVTENGACRLDRIAAPIVEAMPAPASTQDAGSGTPWT